MFSAQIQLYKYTNTQIQHIIVGSIYPIQIYTLGKVCQLNLFIGIGYILPTIGEYMLAEFIYCYWIYSANNWGIYVNWKVSVRPSGAGLRNMLVLKNIHILENAHSATLHPKGAQTPSN